MTLLKEIALIGGSKEEPGMCPSIQFHAVFAKNLVRVAVGARPVCEILDPSLLLLEIY